MSGYRLASALLALLCVTGCSGKWRASVELSLAERTDTQPLQITLSSSKGARFDSRLGDRCIDVDIDQSPKRENRIAIKVTDGSGRVLGEALTHDLANRPLTIVLDGGGQVVVTPNKFCDHR